MPDVALHRHETGSTPAFGFDGTNDHQIDRHNPRSKADRLGISSDLSEANTAGAPGHTSPGRQVAGVVAAEIDPNQDRRKRCKLTPIKEKIGAGEEKPSKTKKTGTGTISWFSQPKHSNTNVQTAKANDESAMTPETKGTKASLTELPPQAALDQSSTQSSLQALPQHSSKSHTASQIHTQRSDAEPLTTKQSLPGPKKATPRKKKISLHTNGTLLSSPRSLPRTSPRLPPKTTEVAKKPDFGRNIKIKNGKFVQSLPIVLKYGVDDTVRLIIAKKIDEILASDGSGAESAIVEQSAKTHPFFLVKAMPKTTNSISDTGDDHSTRGTNQEESGAPRSTAPVPWKDIKFSSPKTTGSKLADSVQPIWPPQDTQHIGRECVMDDDWYRSLAAVGMKQKTTTVRIAEHEDILRTYARTLKNKATTVDQTSVVQKHFLSGAAVGNMLGGTTIISELHPAISYLRAKLQHGTSPFDRGEAGGQNTWSSKYAPSGWKEVLQPSCNVLHDWLQGLAVHNVKVGLDKGKSRTKDKMSRKKKRQTRMRDELDDFIVDSDDGDDDGGKMPNAILISGPMGCGKTASVFAVAKELGFEIFEIHPGMRRSAKDIFDKVGDMTQNHLVQRSDAGSRSSSMPPSDTDVQASGAQAQPTMSSFLGSKKAAQHKKSSEIEATIVKKEQKQSLILFEEVDVLFEEDKAFWTGVQSLIQNSKRPVVMTCNDTSRIPISDLGLYTVLEYTPASNATVTEYLAYLAAAEGHIIDRAALSALYASKKDDLRASITELNLWCQMTVGSKHGGGLDWMLQSVDGRPQVNKDGERLRVFSQGAFHAGLDLVPQIAFEQEDYLRFTKDELGFTIADWYDCTGPTQIRTAQDSFTELQQFEDQADAWSVLDVIDDEAAPVLAASLVEQSQNEELSRNGKVIASLYIKRLNQSTTKVRDLVHALEPIMEEKPVFPPSHGRLAPSLDTASPSVAVDVAPYVRLIVAFDQHLEQYREEVFGSQGKNTRKTRAARAAAEGRDKTNTRTERWFPQSLDFDQVLRTGDSWPQCIGGSTASVDSDAALTPSTINE